MLETRLTARTPDPDLKGGRMLLPASQRLPRFRLGARVENGLIGAPPSESAARGHWLSDITASTELAKGLTLKFASPPSACSDLSLKLAALYVRPGGTLEL